MAARKMAACAAQAGQGGLGTRKCCKKRVNGVHRKCARAGGRESRTADATQPAGQLPMLMQSPLLLRPPPRLRHQPVGSRSQLRQLPPAPQCLRVRRCRAVPRERMSIHSVISGMRSPSETVSLFFCVPPRRTSTVTLSPTLQLSNTSATRCKLLSWLRQLPARSRGPARSLSPPLQARPARPARAARYHRHIMPTHRTGLPPT